MSSEFRPFRVFMGTVAGVLLGMAILLVALLNIKRQGETEITYSEFSRYRANKEIESVVINEEGIAKDSLVLGDLEACATIC